MQTEDTPTSKGKKSGLRDGDCVPFFEKDENQIRFEFFYLIATFASAILLLLLVQLKWGPTLNYSNKLALIAVIGGFLGGWVYDAKWFYRVTARGKSDQYNFIWQPHKFYWRILTPFLSALVAFSTYILLSADFFPFSIKEKESARTAFAVCFVLGYFSDLVLSRLAAWAEKIIPRASNE
jgi:hypothetical protein